MLEMNTFLILTFISSMVFLNTDCCTVCEWSCGDGSCIPMKGRCDSSPDCADGSDEVHCPGKLCPEGLILCQHRNGSQFCIRVGTKCDGVSSTTDTTDNGTATTSPTNIICSTPISTLNVLDSVSSTAATSPTNNIFSTPISTLNVLDITTGDVANPDTLPTWAIILIVLAVLFVVTIIIILAVYIKKRTGSIPCIA